MSGLRKQIFDLAGESHQNSDGTSRQSILRACVPGTDVELVREPNNQHDANAIFVAMKDGAGLGYVSRDDNAAIAGIIDSGIQLSARIHELTGGLPEYPNFGCKISIVQNGGKFKPFRGLQDDQVFFVNAPKQQDAPLQVKIPAVKKEKNLMVTLISRLFK